MRLLGKLCLYKSYDQKHLGAWSERRLAFLKNRKIAVMQLLVKCYDNKKVSHPRTGSSIRWPSLRWLTNNKKVFKVYFAWFFIARNFVKTNHAKHLYVLQTLSNNYLIAVIMTKATLNFMITYKSLVISDHPIRCQL